MEKIAQRLPDHARDLRLNLKALPRSESLSPQQLWGTAVASAIAARDPELLVEVEALAREHLGPEAIEAARTAAAAMAMNNVYYRFVHLSSNPVYGELPARLRMQSLARPGVDPLDFQLWCLAVSAVHGCGACVDSHEKEILAHGGTAQMVQDAVRVAAILHAAAVVLGAERARSSSLSTPASKEAIR